MYTLWVEGKYTDEAPKRLATKYSTKEKALCAAMSKAKTLGSGYMGTKKDVEKAREVWRSGRGHDPYPVVRTVHVTPASAKTLNRSSSTICSGHTCFGGGKNLKVTNWEDSCGKKASSTKPSTVRSYRTTPKCRYGKIETGPRKGKCRLRPKKRG